jgi:hypothetical protein
MSSESARPTLCSHPGVHRHIAKPAGEEARDSFRADGQALLPACRPPSSGRQVKRTSSSVPPRLARSQAASLGRGRRREGEPVPDGPVRHRGSLPVRGASGEATAGGRTPNRRGQRLHLPVESLPFRQMLTTPHCCVQATVYPRPQTIVVGRRGQQLDAGPR